MFEKFFNYVVSALFGLVQSLANLKRLFGWLVLAVVLFGVVGYFAQHLFLVGLFKLSMVFIAAYGLYWFDRTLFYYARPDAFCIYTASEFGETTHVNPGMEAVFAAAQIRRAIMIAAGMIAVAMGA
jgi:Putative 2/3 transmembrane domain holin